MRLEKPPHTSKLGIYAKAVDAKPKQHIALVEAMVKWMDENNGNFKGYYASGFAIAHQQVAAVEQPLKMFVVAKELLINDKATEDQKVSFYFPARAIFNAEILDIPAKTIKKIPKRTVKKVDNKAEVSVHMEDHEVMNEVEMKEACMSFPFRHEKYVMRGYRVKVRYQYLGKGLFNRDKVITVTEWVEGLKAHIFQHECDHFKGKNIYRK